MAVPTFATIVLAAFLAAPLGYTLTSMFVGPWALMMNNQMGVIGCTFFNLTTECDKHPECANLDRKDATKLYSTQLDFRTNEEQNFTSFMDGGAIMAPNPAFDQVSAPTVNDLSSHGFLPSNNGSQVQEFTTHHAQTQQLGSGVVQGVTQAQQHWASTKLKPPMSVVESKSCNLKPGMVYNKKSYQIREWFHMDTPEVCCQKCRTTENCAFFIVNPAAAGHCFLLKIQAKEGSSKKATLKPKKGWIAGSIVDFVPLGSAGGIDQVEPPSEKECQHCPERCWKVPT
jgi:hypothetical protein